MLQVVWDFYILLIRKMTNKQNKSWTEYQDRALKQLKQQRGLDKWTLIAKTLEEEFKIMGKSGKRCRERYFHHIDTTVKKEEWTAEQQVLLEQLHDRKGNKWVQIAKELERSDNDVKNHFHSKLRRAIRKINLLICSYIRNEFKPLKNNIISKILQTTEEAQDCENQEFQNIYKLGQSLKSKILNCLSIPEQDIESDLSSFRTMLKQISAFGKIYRKKGVSRNEPQRQRNCVRYKGKEILNLINQNKIKKQEQIKAENQSSIEEEGSGEQQKLTPENSHKSNEFLIPSQPTKEFPGTNHSLFYPLMVTPFFSYPLHYHHFNHRFLQASCGMSPFSRNTNTAFNNYSDQRRLKQEQQLQYSVRGIDTRAPLGEYGEIKTQKNIQPKIKHEVNHVE